LENILGGGHESQWMIIMILLIDTSRVRPQGGVLDEEVSSRYSASIQADAPILLQESAPRSL